MTYDQATAEYRRTTAQSGTPVELTIMLYDMLVERMRRASRFMPDVEQRTSAISGALRVLDVLQRNLDISGGGEAARNLDLLYTLVRNGVVSAHAHNSAEELEPLIAHMLAIRAAWEQSLRCPPGTTPVAAGDTSALLKPFASSRPNGGK